MDTPHFPSPFRGRTCGSVFPRYGGRAHDPGATGYDANDTGSNKTPMTLEAQEVITRAWGETSDKYGGKWKVTTQI